MFLNYYTHHREQTEGIGNLNAVTRLRSRRQGDSSCYWSAKMDASRLPRKQRCCRLTHLAARPSWSLTPPLQQNGENIKWISSWVEIRLGRSLTNYHHRHNRLNLGKTNFITNSKWARTIRNKSKNTFPHTHPFFPGSTPLPTLLLSLILISAKSYGEQGMQLVCKHSKCHFSSYSSSLPAWDPSHRMQSFTHCCDVESLLWAAVLQKLLQQLVVWM